MARPISFSRFTRSLLSHPHYPPCQIASRQFTTRASLLIQQQPRSPSAPPQPNPPPSSQSARATPEPLEPPRYNFYRTHGRAFFKAFTLAFLTMQCVQWAWLVLETEEVADKRGAEIRALEGEVRLLDEGRGSHRLRRESEEERRA